MAEQKGQVAFIGLGVMGYPMAGHLVKQGYSVSVYNRTGSKAESWCSEYAELAAAQNLKLQAFKTPADAAKGADAVFVCVGNDDDVRQVTMDEQGVLSGMDAGTLLVHLFPVVKRALKMAPLRLWWVAVMTTSPEPVTTLKPMPKSMR